MVNQKDVDEINKKIKDRMKFSNQDLREKTPWVEQMPAKLEQVIDGVDTDLGEADLKKFKSSSEFTEDKWETPIDAIFYKLKIELISIVKTAISEAFEKYGIGGGLQEKESKTVASSVEESNKKSFIPIGSSDSVEGRGNCQTKFKTSFSDAVELVSSFADEGKANSVYSDLPCYNFARILHNRGKEFRRSISVDKYLEDFIFELKSECGYCLYWLIVNCKLFLGDSNGAFYTRLLFDRGKIYEQILRFGYLSKLLIKYSNILLLVNDGDYSDDIMLFSKRSQLDSVHVANLMLQLARENEFGSAQWLFDLMPCSSCWSFHEKDGFALLQEWIYEQLKTSLHFSLLFSGLHVCSHIMIFAAPKGYYHLLQLSLLLYHLKKSYRRVEWLGGMMGIQSVLTIFIITNVSGLRDFVSEELQILLTGSVVVRSIGWINVRFTSVVCFNFSWGGEPDIPFEIVVGLNTVDCLNSKWQHVISLLCASEVYRQIPATLKCKMSWTRNIIVRPYELQWVVPWKLRITSNPYTYVEKIYIESGRLEFMLFPPDVWNVGIILRFRNSPTILQFLVSFKRETIWFLGLQSVETAITMLVMTVGILIVWPSYQRWRFKLQYIKLWSMGNEILTRLVGSKSEKHLCVMAVGCRVMGIQFLIMGSQIINVYLGLVKKYWRLKFRLPLIGLCSVVQVHLVGMGFTWVYYTVPTLIRRIYMQEGIRLIPLTEFQYIMMLHVSVHVIGGIHSFLSQIMAKPQFKWRCLQPLSSALYLIIGYNQVVGVCYFQLTRYLFHYRTHFSRNYPSSTSPVCLFTSWYKGNGGGTVFPCMVLSGCVRLLFSRGRSHKFISWSPRSGKFSTTGLIADLYREESAYWLFYMVDQSGTRGIADMRVKFNCLSTDLWKMRIHLATVTVRLSITLQWTVYFMLTLTLFHLWDVISGCGTSIFEIVADYKVVNILVATENRRFALQGIEDKAAIFFVADSMKTTILRCRELVQHCHLMRYGHLGSNQELLLAVTVFAAEYDKVVSLLIQKMIGEASREALVQVVCEYQFNIHEKEPRQCHNPHVLEVFSLYGMEPGHGIRVHVLKDETVPSNIRWTKGLTYAVGWESGWMHPLELTSYYYGGANANRDQTFT